MTIIWVMTLPGLVVLLIVVIVVDQIAVRARTAGRLPWRGAGREGRVSAVGFEQLHAALAPGKHHELERRAASLMLRDEEGDGAPPRSRVDLDSGTAVIRLSDAPHA